VNTHTVVQASVAIRLSGLRGSWMPMIQLSPDGFFPQAMRSPPHSRGSLCVPAPQEPLRLREHISFGNAAKVKVHAGGHHQNAVRNEPDAAETDIRQRRGKLRRCRNVIFSFW